MKLKNGKRIVWCREVFFPLTFFFSPLYLEDFHTFAALRNISIHRNLLIWNRSSQLFLMVWVLVVSKQCFGISFSPTCPAVVVFLCSGMFLFLFHFFSFFLNRFLLHVENRLPLHPIFCHERLIFLQTRKNVLLFWHFVSLDMVWKPNKTLKTCFSRTETQESSFLFILFNYCKTRSKANTSWLQWKVFSKTEE